MTTYSCLAVGIALFGFVCLPAGGQSADWQSAVFREPQVRYLLADMTLSGNTDLYRAYATAADGPDPDSKEAVRLWDCGARVVNTNEFERRWLTNQPYATKPVLRVVSRGSNRTITGNEVLLTTDRSFNRAQIRFALADLSLGQPEQFYENRRADANVAEALRQWDAGVRLLNVKWFEAQTNNGQRIIVFRGTTNQIDPMFVKLNSDLPYPETNARYFLADISLGGSADFYRCAAVEAHEMGCLEVVARWDAGVRITNLDQFERKKVDGQTLITRKGSKERISGMEVKLTTD